MLGEVSAERFAELARDRKFLRRLADVHDDLADYLSQPRWYQQQQAAGSLPESIGYFSPGVRHHRGAAPVLRWAGDPWPGDHS